MPERTYQIARQIPGQKDATITETDSDGTARAFVVLVPGTPDETRVNVLDGLRRAYSAGQEDRGGELPPPATGMAAEMQEYARDVLAKWAEGYQTLEDGSQRRIDVTRDGEYALILGVQPYGDQRHRYRIQLAIEELSG
jgi:hypothetical protein